MRGKLLSTTTAPTDGDREADCSCRDPRIPDDDDADRVRDMQAVLVDDSAL